MDTECCFIYFNSLLCIFDYLNVASERLLFMFMNKSVAIESVLIS